MQKRLLLLAMTALLSVFLISCGQEEEDVYTFSDAASKADVSSESAVSEAEIDVQDTSSEAIQTEDTSSEAVSDNVIEADDSVLQEDKDEIEKTANKAMKALMDGDIEGIKAAQPQLYDSFLENEYASAMLSSVTATVAETYGEDAEYTVTATDISAGTTDDIEEMQILANSFECDLEVETVRNVTFKVDIEGSLGSDSTESEVPAFYADGTWYIAIFAEIEMSQFENIDPSVFESMANGDVDPSIFDEISGDISNKMIQDMLENLPQ